MCASASEASIVRSLFARPDRNEPHHRGAAAPASPVRITALAERTSGLDEHLGFLLRDMRLALPMTPGELALRLSTTVDVIVTLEQGRLRALPQWEETQRVICGLCALHHVDPRPILHRIFEQTGTTNVGAPPQRGPGALQRTAGHAKPARASVASSVAGSTSPRARPPQVERKLPPWPNPPKTPRRRRGPSLVRGRALMAVAAPMVLVAAVVWTIQAQPRFLRSTIEVLPAPISQSILSGLDTLALRLARRQDGLRWIEVADPSTRKADKLQVGKR